MTAPTPIEELMVKPKLCRDCVWYTPRSLLQNLPVADRSDCSSPKNKTVNLVTGDIEPTDVSAAGLRAWSNLCGPDARWFIAKHGPAVNGAELVSDPRGTVEMDDACSKSAELREGLSEENAA
jgi:hypothetical protein